MYRNNISNELDVQKVKLMVSVVCSMGLVWLQALGTSLQKIRIIKIELVPVVITLLSDGVKAVSLI